MYECEDKMVSHPDHYQSNSGLEVIDVIEAFTANLKGIEATDTGNIIKYACRWKKKNGVQDLRKILWYTNHLKEHAKYRKWILFSSLFKNADKKALDSGDVIIAFTDELDGFERTCTSIILGRILTWTYDRDFFHLEQIIDTTNKLIARLEKETDIHEN